MFSFSISFGISESLSILVAVGGRGFRLFSGVVFNIGIIPALIAPFMSLSMRSPMKRMLAQSVSTCFAASRKIRLSGLRKG